MNIGDYIDDLARSVGFLSRIHVPQRHFIGHDGKLSRAVQAFPVAGVLISLPVAAAFAILLAFNAQPLLAAFIALGLQVLLTGALHEDGLSDTADGIGGGSTREKALAMMRDSQIGAYGAVALILSFGIRAAALASIATVLTPSQAGFGVLGVAAVSRSAMVWHWMSLSPARSDGVAASVGEPDKTSAFVALASGGAMGAIFLLPSVSILPALSTILLAAGLTHVHTRIIERKIGGHTGDTIGASQQISEMAALAALALFL